MRPPSTQILITFLDSRDPGPQSPVQALCRQLAPHAVYLLPCTSSEASLSSPPQEAAQAIRTWLHEAYHPDLPVYIRPLTAEDPEQVPAVLLQARQLLRTILRRWQGQPAHFHLNLVSGTAAMKAALFLLCEAGLIPNAHLWEAAPAAQGQAPLPFRRLETPLLAEETTLERLRLCADGLRFAEMARECLRLREITLCSDRSRTAGLLADVFQAYHHWDLLHYPQACRLLRSVCLKLADIPEAAAVEAILSKQFFFLVRLLTDEAEETLENLSELHYASERCFLRQDYTGVLLRFRRLYAGLGNYLLRQNGQTPPPAEDACTKALLALPPEHDFPLFWHTPLDSQLHGDQATAGSIVQALQAVWPRTLLGHGLRPAGEPEAADALGVSRELARRFLLAPEEYPLRAETLHEVLPFLAQSGVTAPLSLESTD